MGIFTNIQNLLIMAKKHLKGKDKKSDQKQPAQVAQLNKEFKSSTSTTAVNTIAADPEKDKAVAPPNTQAEIPLQEQTMAPAAISEKVTELETITEVVDNQKLTTASRAPRGRKKLNNSEMETNNETPSEGSETDSSKQDNEKSFFEEISTPSKEQKVNTGEQEVDTSPITTDEQFQAHLEANMTKVVDLLKKHKEEKICHKDTVDNFLATNSANGFKYSFDEAAGKITGTYFTKYKYEIDFTL